ncbi:TetR/AcrR family transcriptional regulator [Gorillibacterium timonense]|uniref:TetR/AcrR family transcriptional regulator n=1 Tax=Gorillibacterium timonense TaxID=1689269 RepID=UPI00071CBBAC|nr:TetR/AcrR family transcriptional regulator [Gorillibacterium timonense]
MRGDILKAAREIIGSEGIENVSIRKIAAKIEYSPAMIYHYFSSKEEIIEKLIAEQYAEMVASLSAMQSETLAPADSLRKGIVRFIELAMEMGDFYISLMLNGSPDVLAHTSVLQRGASAERPAIGMLSHSLKEFPALDNWEAAETELTAQVIWSTAFGLAVRLMVEKVDEEQKQRLMDHAVKVILLALGTR